MKRDSEDCSRCGTGLNGSAEKNRGVCDGCRKSGGTVQK